MGYTEDIMKCPICNDGHIFRSQITNGAVCNNIYCDFTIKALRIIQMGWAAALDEALEPYLSREHRMDYSGSAEMTEPKGYYWKDYYKGNNF